MWRWGKQHIEAPLMAAHTDFVIQADSCKQRLRSFTVKPHLQAMSGDCVLLFTLIYNSYLKPQVQGIVAEDNKVNKFINWTGFRVCSAWWINTACLSEAFDEITVCFREKTVAPAQRLDPSNSYTVSALFLKNCLQSVSNLRSTYMLTDHWIHKCARSDENESNCPETVWPILTCLTCLMQERNTCNTTQLVLNQFSTLRFVFTTVHLYLLHQLIWQLGC